MGARLQVACGPCEGQGSLESVARSFVRCRLPDAVVLNESHHLLPRALLENGVDGFQIVEDLQSGL
eukprot:8068545-Pyramimonas_sp.AAC.1